jgi:hypothetical protein
MPLETGQAHTEPKCVTSSASEFVTGLTHTEPKYPLSSASEFLNNSFVAPYLKPSPIDVKQTPKRDDKSGIPTESANVEDVPKTLLDVGNVSVEGTEMRATLEITPSRVKIETSVIMPLAPGRDAIVERAGGIFKGSAREKNRALLDRPSTTDVYKPLRELPNPIQVDAVIRQKLNG